MTCRECGKKMAARRENHRYTESGLPNVILEGVEVRRCPRCGATEIVIPKIEELHRVLSGAIIRKPAKLSPQEIRYLRTYLGWSGVDFAAHMGATPETVSRWEHGASMGPVADRLLRLLVANKAPVDDYSADLLREIGKKGKPEPVRVTADRKGWHPVAA